MLSQLKTRALAEFGNFACRSLSDIFVLGPLSDAESN